VDRFFFLQLAEELNAALWFVLAKKLHYNHPISSLLSPPLSSRLSHPSPSLILSLFFSLLSLPAFLLLQKWDTGFAFLLHSQLPAPLLSFEGLIPQQKQEFCKTPPFLLIFVLPRTAKTLETRSRSAQDKDS
jgi:hypothetical protein